MWSDRYPYSKEEVDEIAPAKGGIYVLAIEDGPVFKVFYVGQSKSIKENLLKHLSGNGNDCIKKHLKEHDCYFRFNRVEIPTERGLIEAKLISDYNPSCNKT